jgi:hypothetical protein
MSEFDPPQTQSTAEDRLMARVFLQRVVFGACALVMVLLFSLGLAAYRQQQQARQAAEDGAATDRQVAADRADFARRLELELADARAERDAAAVDSRRALALAYARLAAADLQLGNTESARALVARAATLDGPAWLGLLTYRLEADAGAAPGRTLAGEPAKPHGAGLIMRDNGAYTVLAGEEWHGPTEALRVVPAGDGVAIAYEGVILTPWAERLPVEPGDRLAAGFHDGSLLVLRGGGRAEWISRTGTRALELPEPADPVPVAVASRALAVLLRTEDGVIHATPRGARMLGPTEVAALSADGTRAVLVEGQEARVFSVQQPDDAANLDLSDAPRAAALLYGGTLLVYATEAALAFIEVATGRVLWRVEPGARALAAAADTRLHIVTAAEVRVLELP